MLDSSEIAAEVGRLRGMYAVDSAPNNISNIALTFLQCCFVSFVYSIQFRLPDITQFQTHSDCDTAKNSCLSVRWKVAITQSLTQSAPSMPDQWVDTTWCRRCRLRKTFLRITSLVQQTLQRCLAAARKESEGDPGNVRNGSL